MYGNVELETVSEVHFRRLLATTIDPNISSPMDEEDHFCKLILYKEIAESRVRIWDVVILIPNLIFLIFIVARFNRARLKLRATSSPIFLAFYGLVVSNILISVIRCVVSMTVNAAATVGGLADKVLWVTVRFFLLSTEMSVVIFGLAFGHLDSRSSIRRVLIATSFIALAFTITQGTLELVLPDDTFEIPSRNFYLFGHGGMMFWFCSSLVFTTIYLFILILPWTRLRERLALPSRKSFYIYVGALALLNLTQSIGAGLLNYTQNPAGLCVVDLTSAIYLTLFTPLVYHTFLSEFFGVSQPSIMFSYKAQVDDAMDEDTVSLPHQQSFSSLKTDSDYIYQVHSPSIHMPLYDPSSLKNPSTSKKRSSIYSLAPEQLLAIDWSRRSSSQLSLRGSTSSAGSNKGRIDLKSAPSPEKKSSMRFKKLHYSPLSTPNLNIDNPIWNLKSDTKRKQESNSASNYTLSPTASNFIYTPDRRDSNVNLFSPSINDDGLRNLDRKAQSSAEITSDSLTSRTVKNPHQGFEIFKRKSPRSSDFLEPDSLLSSKLSINSSRPSENPEVLIDPQKSEMDYLPVPNRKTRSLKNYIGNLSDSNLLFNRSKKQNSSSLNTPSTSSNKNLGSDGELTNLVEIKSPKKSPAPESFQSTSGFLGKDNNDEFTTFSPTKQSTFTDQSKLSQFLKAENFESENNSRQGSLNSSKTQNTDSSFFSNIDKTSDSDEKTLYASAGNSQSTIFYTLNNSDDNSQESSGLSDYLKLFNKPQDQVD